MLLPVTINQVGNTMDTRYTKQNKMVWAILIILPIAVTFLSICFGRYWVAPDKVFTILLSKLLPLQQTWSGIEESIVFQIRLPRILMAILVGAGLSISGGAFQGIFGNPLVSPHILGVSAGAGFGAALGILLSGQVFVIQILSLSCGLLAVLVTYLMSCQKRGASLFMLVLAGTITQAFFTALISLIKYVADPEEKLPTIVYWLMGNLSGISYKDLFVGGPLILTGIVILLLMRWRINILSLSEDEAKALGVNVQRSRWIIIISSTIITAASVSLCGIVGWIGLVIPHICRMIVGHDHKFLLPASISIGAIYLLMIDTLARSATAAEIPLSILTAIIGAPFFAYLLRKTGGNWT